MIHRPNSFFIPKVSLAGKHSSNYHFNISENQFCPEYPLCIEMNLGNQYINECDGVVELWGIQYFAPSITELNLESNGLSGNMEKSHH